MQLNSRQQVVEHITRRQKTKRFKTVKPVSARSDGARGNVRLMHAFTFSVVLTQSAGFQWRKKHGVLCSADGTTILVNLFHDGGEEIIALCLCFEISAHQRMKI